MLFLLTFKVKLDIKLVSGKKKNVIYDLENEIVPESSRHKEFPSKV